MRNELPLPVALLICSALLACKTDEVAVTGPRLERNTSFAADSLSIGRSSDNPVPAVSRFSTSLEITGKIALSQPIHIVASITDLKGTRDVEFRLALPELDYANKTNGRLDVSSQGLVDDKRSAQRVAIARNSRAQRDTTVVITRPGYYRVVASAFQRSDEPPVDNGRWVVNSSIAESWIYVDSTGGFVTAEFDPANVSEKYIARPGAFFQKRTDTRQKNAASPSVAAYSSISRRLVYYDYNKSEYAGLPHVTVYWQYYDMEIGGPFGDDYDVTNHAGYFNGPCPTYTQYAIGGYVLTNAKIQMGEGGLVTHPYFEEGGGCTTYPSVEEILPNAVARVSHDDRNCGCIGTTVRLRSPSA